MIGVQISSMRLSPRVFIKSSAPIPLISPQVKPITGLLSIDELITDLLKGKNTISAINYSKQIKKTGMSGCIE